MRKINLEPTLEGYKNILKMLKVGIKKPTEEQKKEINNLEKYIDYEDKKAAAKLKRDQDIIQKAIQGKSVKRTEQWSRYLFAISLTL